MCIRDRTRYSDAELEEFRAIIMEKLELAQRDYDSCLLYTSVLGAKLVKGLLAPMPWSKLMVTGGVEPTQENLTSWIKAGVFCVGTVSYTHLK